MKFLAVIACVLAVAQSQYVPSGWKPQGARLTLPTEYGAPGQVASQNLEVEITKENIEFAGQLGETTTTEPNNEYLPPTTTLETPEDVPEENQDPLTTQQLPNRDNSRSFNEPPRSGQFRRFQQQQRFARVQAQQQQQQQPQEAYGVPTTTSPVAESQPEEENLTENAEKEVEQVDDEAVDSTIAVANSGQYYVLTPDNTLQKVTFYTRQSEDDRRSNGFSAQLRYDPVEPIRDPIYAYNEQGQLVRVYNKKK